MKPYSQREHIHHLMYQLWIKYLGIGAASKSIIKKKETCVAVSGDITFDAPLTMDNEVTIPFSLEQKIVFDDIISLSKQ